MSRFAIALGLALSLSACRSAEKPAEPPPRKEVGLEAFSPLVGLTVEEAEKWLREHPTPNPENRDVGLRPGLANAVIVRPIEIDGESLVVTDDLKADRVNVRIEKGRIKSVDNVY
jgi:hypothetical protein